jgi:hypothetical protein
VTALVQDAQVVIVTMDNGRGGKWQLLIQQPAVAATVQMLRETANRLEKSR